MAKDSAARIELYVCVCVCIILFACEFVVYHNQVFIIPF